MKIKTSVIVLAIMGCLVFAIIYIPWATRTTHIRTIEGIVVYRAIERNSFDKLYPRVAIKGSLQIDIRRYNMFKGDLHYTNFADQDLIWIKNYKLYEYLSIGDLVELKIGRSDRRIRSLIIYPITKTELKDGQIIYTFKGTSAELTEDDPLYEEAVKVLGAPAK